ncbi:GNAT family N-acetyltransferase [Spiribacter halobius]|uniref:GNAT family N-acetyltransferase n=1 Tax=Sediminicurvatus halobius TaxID=2182432 RepID=A0A2U2N8I8_9GAMM|nr:GNAT family N-acetyltransferase [Spiribacter halobius]PWG65377.1 GNAT family N-acetyltransferase [Spiribacter halobius]UEX76395.1 GNAT family N-acetyltransferase [Spiribacter halobius]
MKLRRYREADVAALVHLFTESVHSLAAPDYAAEQRQAWAPIPPDLAAWRARFRELDTIVAEAEDRVLGFLSYEPNGHIELLYTAPHAARKGVASALLQEAAGCLARVKGTGELFTEASLTAVPFFLKQGFEVTAEQTVRRRGVSFRRFAMRRPAGPR